jgi:hypothetical protein
MPGRMRKVVVWTAFYAVAAAIPAVFWLRAHPWRPNSIEIQGAVIRSDTDPRRELPIGDAVVTASDGQIVSTTQSDASGYFLLTLKESVFAGKIVNLSFRHENYKPLDLRLQFSFRSAGKRLYVARMEPIPPPIAADSDQPPSEVSNIHIRYTVNSVTEEDIGSAVKTFQIVNRGNVPCKHQAPCSPDGSWKASRGSVTMDAGSGNEFRNVRASCIAGPCPFTRIDTSAFAHASRTVTVSALDWSDTATFLFEAEVVHSMIGSTVLESYPVIYGQALNFTLPPTAEGVSIEAEINGAPMVFPLGPDLYLSWADCTARTNTESEKSTVYRCELKPRYRF